MAYNPKTGLPLRGDENLEVRGHSPNGTLPTTATGTYTFVANPTNTQTIVLNGTTVTFVTSGATGNQVNLGADVAATLFNLETFLNATTDTNLVAATYNLNGSVLNITGAPAGVAGNLFTLAAGTYGGTVSGPTLTGGTNAVGGIPAAATFTIQVSDIAALALSQDAVIDALNEGGFVQGPASATNGDIAVFDGTTGKLIKDTSILSANIVLETSGAVTSGHLAVFSGTSGHLIADGGAVPGGGAPGPYLVRNSAAALSAATILANTAGGNNRYVLDSATGVPITLPFPTGTGTVLEFVIISKPTTNGYVFDTGVGGAGINPFISSILGHATIAPSAVTNINVTTAGAHNRVTLLNGTAGSGGDVGDVIYITDAISGQFQISGTLTVDDTSATFSAY